MAPDGGMALGRTTGNIMNPVISAVALLLALSLCRVNVVISLTLSAFVGGLLGGKSPVETLQIFSNGLGSGAEIALSYAMLGAFAVAISQSGITDLLAQLIVKRLVNTPSTQTIFLTKYLLLFFILLMSVLSQNVIPVHIAFIPLLIPPLLRVIAKLEIDRRAIACIMTFGLTATYMCLPVGFGGLFLYKVLGQNLLNNGLNISMDQVPQAMIIPVCGMTLGLLIAVFYSYRQKRQYDQSAILAIEPEHITLNWKHIFIALFAIFTGLSLQLLTQSIIFGALAGFAVLTSGGVVKFNESNDIFSRGVNMMAMIGFIMIAAGGFAAVLQATDGVQTLVDTYAPHFQGQQGLAAIFMLSMGLLITMGIGSSFSTVPIIATLFVPLCIQLEFSTMATIAIIGSAGALGDAGSPASESTLGPTAGLNADGQHDHIRDSVVPTFIHFNLPLLLFSWIASMVL